MEKIFFNYPFNKGKLKTLLIWSILNTGQYNMINLVENLKKVGFQYATTAGISLGIDDLKTISTKYDLIEKTNDNIKDITNHLNLAVLNEVEHSQKLINSWQKISEILKININKKFKTVNKLNPIYMMAFSGARGNISQVRQLIGMRGLMADPNGQIIHLPIKSNFREGLTVTEYLISCYGARKGVVDTALRTATAGYLTRRLVDTAQHVIISQLDCGTKQGIFLSNLYQGTDILLALKDQLYGRVLGKDIKINSLMYLKNQQIDDSLSILLANHLKRVFIRSPLTCKASNSTLCQLCYGWNLSHSKLISLGEIVGVIAAQSIGEPGTQLTMRTFHTGGVFSGNVKSQLYSPFDGIVEYSSSLYGDIVNLYNGNFAFLVKRKGLIIINPIIKKIKPKKFEAILYTLVFVKNNEKVKKNQLIAQQSNKISNTQQIEGKYTVNSKLEGEILFDENHLSTNKKKIWILHGKIYKSVFPLQLFPKKNDFLSYKFPLAQAKLLNLSASFLKVCVVRKKRHFIKDNISQSNEILLFTEYPLYKFLIKNIKNYHQFQFFYPIQNKIKEVEKSLRINNKVIKDNRIKIPFNSIAKSKLLNLLNKRLEQNTFFSKNTFSNYYENTDERTTWFTQNSILKYNAIYFYKSSKSVEAKTSRKIPITFNSKNFLIKEKLFFIKNNSVLLPIFSSDFFTKFTLKNEYFKPKHNIQRKLGFLSPTSYFKYISNNYFLKYLNFYQKHISVEMNDIIKVKLYYKQEFEEKTNFKKQNLHKIDSKINLFMNKLILVIEHLILTKLFSTKINNINYLLFYFNYLKYLKESNKFTIFYCNKKKETIFDLLFLLKTLNTTSNLIILAENKISTKLLSEFIYQTIYLIKNNITINSTNSVLENFNYFQQRKEDLFQHRNIFEKVPNFSGKRFSNLSLNINNENYSISKAENKMLIQDLLTLTILNNNIKYFNSHKSFLDKRFFYNESLPIPKILKDFTSILNRINFWSFSSSQFYKKHFLFALKTDNLINIKNKNFIFISRIPQIQAVNFALKKSLKSSFDLKSYEILQYNLKFPLGFYSLIKMIIEERSLFDIDYFQKFIIQYKNFSFHLINKKLKNIFTNNSYGSFTDESTLLESKYFNKRRPTKTTFSKLMNQIKFKFFIKVPLLLSTFSKKDTVLFNIFITNKKENFRNYKIVNMLTNDFYKNLNLQTHSSEKNSQLKLSSKNLEIFNLFYTSSIINVIMKKSITNFNKNFFIDNLFQFSKTHFNWLPKWDTIVRIQFLSPYQGEIIAQNIVKYSGYKTLYNHLMILTKNEKLQVSIFRNKNQETIIKKDTKNYFITKPHCCKIYPKFGSLIYSTSQVSPGKKINQSGQIIEKSNSFLVLRKGTPLLSPITGIFYVWNGDFVSQGSPIMTLLYNKLKTGDIVQGIPKIEHFFEARKGNVDLIQTNLYIKLLAFFKKYNKTLSEYRAVKRSILKIQKIIIDGVCRVYCSQGILVSRKHFEVIVKQMTSKVKIVNGGETGLLEGEFINFQKLEKINTNLYHRRVVYEPLVLGITKVSLRTESFISSASFQETTKVLSQAALEKRIDFLNGLKENVILGKLIPGGTGLIVKIITNKI